MDTLFRIAALSIGGTLGVNARYWLGAWINQWTTPQFPWATVSINVSGSFLIGFLSVSLARWLPHPHIRLLVITGFLGGYTTFSTFENDALVLWERGETIPMAFNLFGSVAIGFVAVVLGTGMGRGLSEPAAKHSAAVGAIEKPRVEHVRAVPNERRFPPAAPAVDLGGASDRLRASQERRR